MGPLGYQEMVFIFVLALLVFGPKKLPELGKTIGKALTEFRRASSELKSTWDREMSNLEREAESVKEVTSSVQNELTDYSSQYTYEDGSYDSSSYDSTVSDPSTVSASAPEGAELIADGAQEHGVTAAEAATEDAGAAPEAVVADAGEPGIVAGTAEVTQGGLPSEPRTVAS
jgi:TatA/E family protein of Tat protein translocase